jgi:hypothetical protein
MRTAFNGSILEHEGNFAGFNLGSDFCAEHERGCPTIKNILGLKKEELNFERGPHWGDLILESLKPFGRERRQITELPEDAVFFHKTKKFAVLEISDNMRFEREYGYMDEKKVKNIKWNLARGKYRTNMYYTKYGAERDLPFVASWSERGFAILVPEKHIEKLEKVYEAFKAKDIVFYIGASLPVFDNGGMMLVIASALDDSIYKDWVTQDEGRYNLTKEAQRIEKETQLKEKIEEAGKGFHALSPSWNKFKDDKSKQEKGSKYDIIYWLNPRDQQDNRAGWFVIEELLQWAEGKGPIPFTDEEKAEKQRKREESEREEREKNNRNGLINERLDY